MIRQQHGALTLQTYGAVALPPLTQKQAAGLLDELKVSKLLPGVRGAAPADLGAVARAITGLAELAELASELAGT